MYLDVLYVLEVKMVSVTLSMPEDVKHKMDGFSWINWSGLAREAFVKKMDEFEVLEKITSKSKLSEKDAKKLADEINKRVSERFMGEK